MEVDGTIAVIGAVGTLLAGTVGALGAWYLKILAEKNKMMLAEKELDLKARKEDASAARTRDTIRELSETVEQLGEDRETDRQLIHELRDRLNAQGLELAVCKTKLDACEEDRAELRAHLISVSDQVRKLGGYVPPVSPPTRGDQS